MTNSKTFKSKSPKSLLAQADEIINGQRQEDYGDPQESFDSIATMWSTILKSPVSSRQVILMMVALKVCRASANPDHFDSYLDIAGYAGLTDRVK